jgi:CheY-like chemotaxis protein
MPQAVIVLIDDDRDFLEINKMILENYGYTVRCFTDQQDALAAMQAEPPDLIVTDLMMNTFDAGFSLARTIKADPRLHALPVIIVSAISSQLGFNFIPHSPEDLQALHADAFLSKPVKPKILVEKIEELLAFSIAR